MAYIGKTPTIGNFQVCDAISVVNGQAAYTMQVGGVNVSPESANHMLVSLNGILQAPTSSFTVSGSTITFASNLVTGDVIDFIQILGNVLDLGVPSDSTVSLAKLTATGTKDATTFLRGDNTFASAGSPSIDDNGNATAITIDSSENVGIGTASPTDTNGFGKALDIQGSTGAAIYVGSSGDRAIFGYASGEQHIINPSASGTTRFSVNGAERMRINSSGKVLINTTVSDNGNVVSSGNGTSGNTACYGLVRGSFKSTLGMDSVGNMNIRNFSGEIYVTDSGGSSTTISPHNFSVIPDGASEDLAWSYYSRNGDVENDFDNTKYISADITKVIRKVENLTGDKLIYTGTGSTDDGSTVSQNIIQDLITRIETLEAKVTALENA